MLRHFETTACSHRAECGRVSGLRARRGGGQNQEASVMLTAFLVLLCRLLYFETSANHGVPVEHSDDQFHASLTVLSAQVAVLLRQALVSGVPV